MFTNLFFYEFSYSSVKNISAENGVYVKYIILLS